MNTYITWRIAWYKQTEAPGEYFWEVFREDFGSGYNDRDRFSIETWKLAYRIALRNLREHLVSHGVWVRTPRRGVSCAEALQECLEWDKFPTEADGIARPKLLLTQASRTNAILGYSSKV